MAMKRPRNNGEHRWEPSPDSFDDDGFSQEDAALEQVCWRCDKQVVPVAGRCPYCRAKLEDLLEDRIVLPAKRGTSPLFKVIWIWVGLMVISLVLGVTLLVMNRNGLVPRDAWEKQVLIATFIAEGLGMVLILAGWLWLGFPPRLHRPEPLIRVLAWVWSLPVLAILLGVNVGYHLLLNRYLELPRINDMRLTVVTALEICVLPAVAEEFFFRYLAFNSLRQYLRLHGTVWVTATLFGMAHIGAPLSIPILVLVGVVLGYARLASAGLPLPILIHFSHNLAILYLNS
jgi:membrane protease YdiL (CAAX protease family)